MADRGGLTKNAMARASVILILASGQLTADFLTTDAKNVYWTDQAAGTVSQVSVGLAFGPEVQLASAQMTPHGVATDGKEVFWVDLFGHTVMETAVR